MTTPPDPEREGDTVGLPEFARLVGMPESTVRYWREQNWLQGVVRLPSGRYLVPRSEVARVRALRAIPPTAPAPASPEGER